MVRGVQGDLLGDIQKGGCKVASKAIGIDVGACQYDAIEGCAAIHSEPHVDLLHGRGHHAVAHAVCYNVDRFGTAAVCQFKQELLEVRDGPLGIVFVDRVAQQGTLARPTVADRYPFEGQVDGDFRRPLYCGLNPTLKP